MIEIDYGKEAYVKLQQLDKYVKKLEANIEKCTYNELRFELGGESEVLELEKSFTVEAFKSGKHYFHFNMRANLVGMLGIMVKVYVNDVISYNFICSLDVDYPFIVEPSLNKGENVVRISMTSLSPFTIEYLNVTVNGLIDYSKGDNRLSLYSQEEKDYVVFLNEKDVEIHTYDSSGNLRYFRYILNVKDACILGVDSFYMYLAVIGQNDALSVKRINLTSNYLDDYPLSVGGVTSVAGFITSDGLKVLFCKLYNLYEGAFDLQTAKFTFFNTNKKAVKVYADANLSNCFVIKDKNGVCSFVNERGVALNLSKGDKFHVSKTDNGYAVEFCNNDKLLSQQISGLKITEAETVDYCDERIKLFDGKYLTRLRDLISIRS